MVYYWYNYNKEPPNPILMIKAPALFHLCFGLWAQADSPAGPAVPQFPRLPLIMWQAAGPLEVLGVFGGFWVLLARFQDQQDASTDLEAMGLVLWVGYLLILYTCALNPLKH